MTVGTNIPRFLLAAVLVITLAMSAACGRKSALIPPGTVLPEAVSDLTAGMQNGRVILAWTMPARDTSGSRLTGLAGFVVMRTEGPADGSGCMCEFAPVATIDLALPEGAVVIGNRIAWTDTDPAVVPGKRYAYKVAAFNSDDYQGPGSGEVRFMFANPPVKVMGLSATPGNGTVVLAWDAAGGEVSGGNTTDISGDITGYNVYRASGPGLPLGSPQNREPVAGASYTDSGLKNNTAYFYRVCALRGSEPPYSEGMPSDEVKAVPSDTEPPQPPMGLRAVAAEGAVLLSWLPSPEPDVAGYTVYRKGPGEDKMARLTESPTGMITYKDEAVRPGIEYTYAVTAVDNAMPGNESLLSERATATPMAAGN